MTLLPIIASVLIPGIAVLLIGRALIVQKYGPAAPTWSAILLFVIASATAIGSGFLANHLWG